MYSYVLYVAAALMVIILVAKWTDWMEDRVIDECVENWDLRHWSVFDGTVSDCVETAPWGESWWYSLVSVG